MLEITHSIAGYSNAQGGSAAAQPAFTTRKRAFINQGQQRCPKQQASSKVAA
jgi:hypothetical protein